MRKGKSALVDIEFRGLGSASAAGDALIEVESLWALPVSMTLGIDGTAARVAGSLQGVRLLADGTFRYAVKVLAVDYPNPRQGKDLGSMFPVDGQPTSELGRDGGPEGPSAG